MFFNNNSISHQYTVDDFQSFETYILNHPEKLTPHIHKTNICSYPNIKYFRSYERNFIYRNKHRNIYAKCMIAVVYCDNCECFHALLPYAFIIPYYQYSLAFVISVLYDRLSCHLTVQEITDKYDISKNTLYRWIDAYKHYYRMFMTMRNKKHMDFFVSFFADPVEFVDALFDITLTTLFQKNLELFRPDD